MVKVESGAYVSLPVGASSSRATLMTSIAAPATRAKKWPSSMCARSSAFWRPNEFIMSSASGAGGRGGSGVSLCGPHIDGGGEGDQQEQ
jgi:hypothetical protein